MTDGAAEQSQRITRVRGRDVTIDQRIVNYFGGGRPPLLPPFTRSVSDEPDGSRGSRLELLRAYERRIPLVGRDELMSRAEAWLQEPAGGGRADHRVLIIHGPGGAGKTRLAAEILDIAADEEYVAGFLAGMSDSAVDWARLGHPERPLAIAIDYAEARHQDLKQLFQEAPIGHEGQGPLRVILIVREGRTSSESWFDRLTHPWKLDGRAESLLEEGALNVFSLEDSLPNVTDRQALWEAGHEIIDDTQPPPPYLAHPLFERPLYVLLDAVGAAEADEPPPGPRAASSPPSATMLLRGILRHERNYWAQARTEASLDLDERQMNQVAVVATLVGGVSVGAFEEALSGLTWLERDHARRQSVADWWCSVYATSADTIRGVEPDIVGEHQVVRAIGPRLGARDQLGGSFPADRLASLAAAATLSGRQRILRVLSRIAHGEDDASHQARTVLADMLNSHIGDFLPKTFSEPFEELATPGVGESVAATIATAVLACGTFELVTSPQKKDSTRDEADESAHSAALEIVRLHIERVAERELDAGRWSIERYAEIISWAMRCDPHALAPGREAERLARVESHQPRPHLALSRLYMQVGRRAGEELLLDVAEWLYEQALAELRAVCEQDSAFAYVLWHDLGDVASARYTLRLIVLREAGTTTDDAAVYDSVSERWGRLALERYERAYAGKRRLRGLADSDVITTLVCLVEEIARHDLDEALARLTSAETEFTDGPEVLSRLRHTRITAQVRGAQQAECEGRYRHAEERYRRTLASLEAAGAQDTALAYEVWRDLGDIASASGAGRAAEYYEHALEGKKRLGGADDPSTLTTLTLLAKAMAKQDLDRALEWLAKNTREFAESGVAPDQLERLDRARMEILSESRRYEEAKVLARSLLQAQGRRRVHRAIFDAAGDYGTDPHVTTTFAVEASLLAVRVFRPGDPRLPALASRLSALLFSLVAELVIVQTDAIAWDSLALAPMEQLIVAGADIERALHHLSESGAAALLSLSLSVSQNIAPAVNGPAGAAAEMHGWLNNELSAILQEPLVSSIGQWAGSTVGSLADDSLLRRWLMQTVVRGPFSFDEEVTLNMIASLLCLYVGVRVGMLGNDGKGRLESLQDEIWSRDDIADAIKLEQERLIEDMQTVGTREPSSFATSVHLATAYRTFQVAQLLDSEDRRAESSLLYRRAVEELEGLGEPDAVAAYKLWHCLGDTASAEGNVDLAVERFTHALNGRGRLCGAADPDTANTLLRLAEETAKVDLDRALDGLRSAEGELARADAPTELTRVRSARPNICFHNARQLALNGHLEPAERFYLRALEELAAIGEQGTALIYVILHDLGDVVRARGDRRAAVAYYERALAGKTRLRGHADPDTVGTLVRLLDALTLTDPGRARRRIADAARELASCGAPPSEIRMQMRRLFAWLSRSWTSRARFDRVTIYSPRHSHELTSA